MGKGRFLQAGEDQCEKYHESLLVYPACNYVTQVLPKFDVFLGGVAIYLRLDGFFGIAIQSPLLCMLMPASDAYSTLFLDILGPLLMMLVRGPTCISFFPSTLSLPVPEPVPTFVFDC
jgi:hypothetical protein